MPRALAAACAAGPHVPTPALSSDAQLASTEEWIDGQFSGNLGEVLIRCNNVLYLRGVPEDEEGQ
jgi:hypothetical protein